MRTAAATARTAKPSGRLCSVMASAITNPKRSSSVERAAAFLASAARALHVMLPHHTWLSEV